MRKVIYTAIILLVLSLPFSCGDGCDDSDVVTTVTSMTLRFGTYTPGFQSRAFVPYDSAIFLASIDEVDRETAALINFEGFMNRAYAEDCGFFVELKHKLTAINITSDDMVVTGGETYPAGTSLNDLFDVSFFVSREIRYTLDEMVDFLRLDSFDFSDQGDVLEFRILAAPDVEINQMFTFTFDFEDRTIVLGSGAIAIPAG